MELETKFTIDEILDSPNLAENMSEKDLDAISLMVHDGFTNDLLSRSSWETRMEDSLKLALQIVEGKSFPWQNASNVKFPLITIAALQYHARSYPILLNGDLPVKCSAHGSDPEGKKQQRADRVSEHMSYQILEQDESWEEEMDRVLITQPILGCAFKKTYYDPLKKHPVSENILAKDLVVNYWTKSLDTAPRITQIHYMTKNDIYTRVARGVWLDIPLEAPPQSSSESNLANLRDKAQGMDAPVPTDPSSPYEILEQHCTLDLDGDGYEEPYIVYQHRDTKKIRRIVARFYENGIEKDEDGVILSISPEKYYTKFPFIPSPDGGFYDLGFGVLLGPLNHSIDTLINQLIDAGTMAVTAGGFLARGIKLRGGNYSFAPLEWKHVDTNSDDLRKGIVPLPVREPSNVLFTLLNLLINYGERVGGSVDILVGQNPGQNTPAETSRTMAEQGMKIFSGIFKRTYRSLRSEFRKIYRLNQLFLREGTNFDSSGASGFVAKEDYLGPPTDISPSADPNIVSDTQRLMQAQAILDMARTMPGVNIHEAQLRYARALKIKDIDKLLPDPKGPNAVPPLPNPKLQAEQVKAQTKLQDIKSKFQLGMAKLLKDAQESEARTHKFEAEAIKALEEAKGVNTGHMVALINAQLAAQKQEHDSIVKEIETMISMADSLGKEEATPPQ